MECAGSTNWSDKKSNDRTDAPATPLVAANCASSTYFKANRTIHYSSDIGNGTCAKRVTFSGYCKLVTLFDRQVMNKHSSVSVTKVHCVKAFSTDTAVVRN